MRLAGISSLRASFNGATVPCASTPAWASLLMRILVSSAQAPYEVRSTKYINSPHFPFVCLRTGRDPILQSIPLSLCFYQPHSLCYSSPLRTLPHAMTLCMPEWLAAVVILHATLKVPPQQMNHQSARGSLPFSSTSSTPSIARISRNEILRTLVALLKLEHQEAVYAVITWRP